MMIVTVLLTALAVIAAAFLVDFVRIAIRQRQWQPNIEAVALGAITNFFDTLGIGSFAPTTAWLKLRKMVPDGYIPATLNVGHALPTFVEAFIFVVLVSVNTTLLIACIASAVVGSIVGASIVVRLPVRIVQGVVGIALLIASGLYAMQNLGLFPGGGAALGLPPIYFAIAIIIHFVLGALMTFGIGLYAPSLISLSLMGLNPQAAFPIMMGACAFLMPVSSFRFIRADRIDLRVALGISIGGAPAVWFAAKVIKSLPLVYLRWGVVVVVLYAAVLLLRSAMKGAAVAEVEPAVSGAQ
jgi:uncharacterized membrane protein YfcA